MPHMAGCVTTYQRSLYDRVTTGDRFTSDLWIVSPTLPRHGYGYKNNVTDWVRILLHPHGREALEFEV